MRTAAQRIGLMGGSFDPIHIGHICIAGEAYRQAKLDQVLFIPSGNPPHKRALGASPRQRLEMVELAIADLSWAKASDIEIVRSGIIYTVDTLTLLHRRLPGKTFYYIIGADTLLELKNWREMERVATLCSFLVVHRPGFPEQILERAAAEIKTRYDAGVRLLAASGPEVSSTAVREALYAGLPVQTWLPQAVGAYIRANGLYQRVDE